MVQVIISRQKKQKTWQLINEILKRWSDNSEWTSFNVQGESITDNQEIADVFNDCFCSVASDLSQESMKNWNSL